MMSPTILLCLLAGVGLSAGAQIVLKLAMMRPQIQSLLSALPVSPAKLATEMLRTPELYAGMTLYGLSMVVWLFVLSKVDVSFAYPFVGLGIIMTTLAGYFILAEPVNAARLAGCLIVAVGIVVVAKS